MLRGAGAKAAAGQLGARSRTRAAVIEQTYRDYWHLECGGLKKTYVRRLKELERENGRLKRVITDLTLH